MGLLDFQMPGMDTPEGQGLLSAAFSLMQAQKYPGQKGSIAGALGDAGKSYLQTTNSSKDAMQRRKYQDAQMEAQQMQFEAARRQQAERERMEAAIRNQFAPQSPLGALQGGGGPTVANAQKIGQMPQFNPRQLLADGGVGALEQGLKINSALNPRPEYKAYKPGDVIFKDGDMSNPVFSVPDKPDALPSAVREYQFAQGQGYKGTFDQWNKDTKRAGATNIGMPKIDIKMGDSVAGQVGPIGSASRTKAEGAVTMFDAADRIQKALDSGKVSSGPGSAAIQTVKQLIQKVSGGNDEGIRQTQQVIRSLAKMAVEARKQLAGQGQVTENEARAVEKADGGNIDDLTTGELQDLVTLTKRASHFAAKAHQDFLDTMEKNDGTRGAAPFYKVRGLDPLLSHVPKLPQIGGGGGDVRSRADAILGGK